MKIGLLSHRRLYSRLLLTSMLSALLLLLLSHSVPLKPLSEEESYNETNGEALPHVKRRAREVASRCTQLRAEVRSHFLKDAGHHDDLVSLLASNAVLMDEQRSFFFCKTPKVASSSWVDLLLPHFEKRSTMEALGRGRRHTLLQEHMRRVNDSLDLMVANTLSHGFLTVRHPFDRLYSAYKDKFIPDDPDRRRVQLVKWQRFYMNYGQHIISKYRRNVSDESTEPTFSEFASFLIDSPLSEDNHHWMPISRLCLPCHLHYDLVAKLESFRLDSHEITRQLNLAHEDNVVPHTNEVVKSNKERIEAFQQLERKTIEALYQRYWLDFQLFGYALDHYSHLLSL